MLTEKGDYSATVLHLTSSTTKAKPMGSRSQDPRASSAKGNRPVDPQRLNLHGTKQVIYKPAPRPVHESPPGLCADLNEPQPQTDPSKTPDSSHASTAARRNASRGSHCRLHPPHPERQGSLEKKHPISKGVTSQGRDGLVKVICHNPLASTGVLTPRPLFHVNDLLRAWCRWDGNLGCSRLRSGRPPYIRKPRVYNTTYRTARIPHSPGCRPRAKTGSIRSVPLSPSTFEDHFGVIILHVSTAPC